MPKTGIDTASLQGAIIPALGVVPPSKSASHSSNRRAPPRSAASDDATESTQASMRMGAVSYDSSLGDAPWDELKFLSVVHFRLSAASESWQLNLGAATAGRSTSSRLLVLHA